MVDDLGIAVSGPVEIVLPSGQRFEAPLLVHDFGGPKGMVVVCDGEIVLRLGDEIVEAGYGISNLGEPWKKELYDRQTHIEMLSEWGWWGPESSRPEWLLEQVSDEDEDEDE